ncbi:HflK protein [Canicola haemoglobinophilus]|uniref:HflK protein n=1 Tax=Canicola haemoglobinophilus TaxID=733 RepID=A0AB38HBX6_9PAST|nr:HflK protein [Canicola haemoglobinophilus]
MLTSNQLVHRRSDAIKARRRSVNREAEAYAREQEPRARGDAQRIIEQATAYKEQIVLNAQGEVERSNVYYQNLKHQNYCVSNGKKHTPKMLDNNSGNNLTVLPLEQILSGKNLTEKTNTPVKTYQTNDKNCSRKR